MLQEFTGAFFIQSGRGSNVTNTLQTAVLVDSDLTRGNNETEIVTREGTDFEIFNGYIAFVQTGLTLDSVVRQFEDGEVATTVTFNDGSTLDNVLGLFDLTTASFGFSSRQYALDQDALEAVGKTMADVADVDVTAFVDHDLSWEDLGFTPTGNSVPAPDPEPEPEPDPVFNVVEGTGGRDRLIGTDGDDAIIGGAGNDRLFGGEGEDVFIFGAEADNGLRERDVIRDFNADEDTIVFEEGAVLRFVEQRGDNLVIRLEGDRDTIVVRDADIGIVGSFEFTNDSFLA